MPSSHCFSPLPALGDLQLVRLACHTQIPGLPPSPTLETEGKEESNFPHAAEKGNRFMKGRKSFFCYLSRRRAFLQPSWGWIVCVPPQGDTPGEAPTSGGETWLSTL